MKKREAQFQTVFSKYLLETKLLGHFELKYTDKEYIYYSRVAANKNQMEGLKAAQENVFVWKHSDQDERPKPFDCSCIPPLTGYVVIRYPKTFYIIKIDDFMIAKEKTRTKWLSRDEAFSICYRAVQY